ncbi:MAG: hypothetical protein M3Q65_08875 [Chloroflexota bacterium]|nr:hypothetical protein [Chloroflexota bacterium]
MKKWAIIGGVVAAIVLAIIIGLLYWGDEGPPTDRLRDISVIFISLFAVFNVLLLAAILGAILWLVLTLRNRVIPLLETLTATAARIRGTTEFVTEQAVSPIISVAGTMARMRAMTKTVTGGRRRPVPRKRPERLERGG